MKRYIEQNDILNIDFLSSPAISPDERYIAYRVSRANRDSNDYSTDIWLYDLESGSNRRLTSSGSEQFFCWNADSSGLIFASKRVGKANKQKEKKGPETSFYSININGGEADALFTIPHASSAIKFLDDSRFLITATFEPVYDNPEDADFMIFEQVPFCANGKGYTGQQRTGLGVFDLKAKEFKRLTSESMEVERVSLNRERTCAVITASDYKDVKSYYNGVYELNLEDCSINCLSEGLKYFFKHAAWQEGKNASEKTLVVSASDCQSIGRNQNSRFYTLKDKVMACISPELDSSLANAIVADCSYGCAEQSGAFFISSDGLVCCSTERIKSRLCSLGYEGRLKHLTMTTSAVIDYSVSGSRIAYIAFEGLYPAELYVLDGNTEKRLTSFNRPLFDEIRMSLPIHVNVDNGEGLQLDGWYMRPVNYQEGKKYPAILNIHGGPKAAFGDILHHEMQYWAAQGYAVLYCNPRGGDGRGDAFADIRGKYGDVDYKDLMAFTDWCVKNLKFIDTERMAVTGGSYGGYMTNWMITQTDFFKAAVAQRSISNWVSKFGSSDIGYYYVNDQHLGTPWKDSEGMWEESPLKHVHKAKTPTLFVHSTEDYRCELQQGTQMFTALKFLGVPSRMCVFRGENHELSRSGKPRNRLARLREILAWFDLYLKK